MHSVSTFEDDTVSEAPLAFLLRPSGSSPAATDKSAGRVLEVAHILGDAVVDIRYYARNGVVRLGAGDDFQVPDDLLPEAHFPLLQHDGTAWVARVSPSWAGFLDLEETRTELHERAGRDGVVRISEDETLVLEVGQSLFVVRTVWRSKRLPVALVGTFDPFSAALVGAVGVLAALLGMVVQNTPAPIRSDNDAQQHVIDLSLYLPKKEVPPPSPTADNKPERAKAGGGNGPKDPKPSLEKHAGNPDAQVVRNTIDTLFAGVDAALSETGLSATMAQATAGLIGSRGTQLPGAGGLTSGRCLTADCMGVGLATGPGMGDSLNGPRNRGGDDWGGDFKATKSGGDIQPVSGEAITIGGIDKAAVDAVVKQHLRSIRHCYSRELQKMPDLAGKVTVKFVIASDGSVSSSTISKTTLGNAAAESCISGRFSKMQFPPLKGNKGIAIISYPFLFAQTN